jgi:hypothetical protein
MKNCESSYKKLFYFLKGVSCDICKKSNFVGKRYKCLICYDFDLCSECYDQSQLTLQSNISSTKDQDAGNSLLSNQNNTKSNKSKSTIKTVTNNATLNNIQINQHTTHINTHAMQCILTRADHELFYGNNSGKIYFLL